MAIGKIYKHFLVKEFSYTFPEFASGSAGTRIDFKDFNTSVSGYKIVSAIITSAYAGVLFLCSVCVNGDNVRVIRTRTTGGADTSTYPCTIRVLYQKE